MTYSPHRRYRLSGLAKAFLRKLGRPFNSAGESHTYAEITGKNK